MPKPKGMFVKAISKRVNRVLDRWESVSTRTKDLTNVDGEDVIAWRMAATMIAYQRKGMKDPNGAQSHVQRQGSRAWRAERQVR